MFALCINSLAAENPVATAKLDRTNLEARASQSTILTVSAFGRYAVTSNSAQGVALQAVDRMTGTGKMSGEAGKQDGRLDVFLDRGEYKILTHAAVNGKGKVALAAHAFRELQEHVPALIEHRMERASLGDFEQRSYWIEIKEKRTVALEAAGRHLADLRLWRDGTWLVDAAPQMLQSQASTSQPLLVARLTTELSPGLYLLSAYGGPGQIWTEASEAKPFFLRYGIATLAPAMRQQFTMSEFGTDRYLVPEGPNYFRLELPSAHAASLQVSSYVDSNPFKPDGQSATLDKRSVPPVAELENVSSGSVKLVTISMEAGKSFVLQHFDANTTRHFDGAGQYWLSSMHAGFLEDSVGASAVLTRRRYGSREEYMDERVLQFEPATAWHRRLNLLGELTMFIKLTEPGKIQLTGTGVKAHYRFEPFLTSRPNDYKTPPWRDSGYTFELDRGLYVLTISPETKGILDLHLTGAGGAIGQNITQNVNKAISVLNPSGTIKALLDNVDSSKNTNGAMSALNPSIRFSPIFLERNTYYTLYLNQQPGVPSGVLLRSLPINLDFALPVTLRAAEALSIPVLVSQRGTLQAVSEDGKAVTMTLSNGKTGSVIEVEAGQLNVALKGTEKTQNFSLKFEPAKLSSHTPLPAMPDAQLAGIPKFPVITADVPRYVELGPKSTTVQSVRVDKAGLYQFESTGLLHTKGKVRTRMNPSLFSESENGVGGNFQIQRYLREGEYQLSVSTLGKTAGDLGVQLARGEIIDGGQLREGQVARTSLPTAHAIAYRFQIKQRATYHLHTLGLGRKFNFRLEDDAGWPIGEPVRHGDLNERLEAGNYRIIVLPQTSDARVLTQLQRIAAPKQFQGHGPHRIALDSSVAHVWHDTAKNTVADQWEFVLPATADVMMVLDSEMEASLMSATDPKKAVLAKFDSARAWRGRLASGRYLLHVRNSRLNNHVPYTFQLSSTQLMAGQSRAIMAPASVPLSVGANGLIELDSFGSSDVRATLQDSAGNIIAQNDDRNDDWNFQIAQNLRPGEYKLLVDPLDEKEAQTIITMNAPAEVLEKTLALGSNMEIADANVHIYPLAIPLDRNLLMASASSSDVVGIALEGESATGWINLGSSIAKNPYIALPLPGGNERYKSYRLRSWSVDRSSLRLQVRAVSVTLPSIPESQWLQGLTAIKIDEARPGIRAAMVALPRAGTFRMKGDISRLRWSDSGARATQGQNNAVVSISGKTLWLVNEEQKPTDVGSPSSSLGAERLRLPTADQDSLRLELMPAQIGAVELSPHPGPSLVLSRSRVGQPGIMLSDTPDLHSIGLMPGEAVALALPGAGTPLSTSAKVWNASNLGGSLELDLRQVPLQQMPIVSRGVGQTDGVLKARSAQPMKLAGSAGSMLKVRLTLAPTNAAVFLKKGIVQSTHWSANDTLYETVSTDADQVWLINADVGQANYSLEIEPGTGDLETALKPGGLLEKNLSTVGRIRIPVEVPKSIANAVAGTLRVRGNGQAIWLERGGRVVSGNDIVIRDSGILTFQHQPGTLIAWLEAPQAQSEKRLAAWLKTLQETIVKPPQAVSLHGKQQVLKLHFEQAAMLHVHTTVPVVTQFFVGGQMPKTEAHLFGANINLLVPAGASHLVLRAVGADSLSGVATFITTSVSPLKEGAGTEVLLAPGSARLYSFEIKQQRPIGIGVRASSDIVRSTLFDEHGRALSEGVVQMQTLAPGRYYIAIDLPAGSPPVRIQPIILGLNEPDTRPPMDVLRRYVESKKGETLESLLFVPVPVEIPSDLIQQSAEEGTSEPNNGSDEPGDQDGSEPSEPATNEETQ